MKDQPIGRHWPTGSASGSRKRRIVRLRQGFQPLVIVIAAHDVHVRTVGADERVRAVTTRSEQFCTDTVALLVHLPMEACHAQLPTLLPESGGVLGGGVIMPR